MNRKELTKSPSFERPRDYYIDNIKGIFIFFVVVGHLLDYPARDGSSFAIGVRTFIYFFHMPGFIFISGYLAKNFLKKPYKGEKLFTYAWLYLLFKDAIELVHYIFSEPYFENGKHHREAILVILLFCSLILLLSWAYHKYHKFRIVFMLFVIGISLVNTNIFFISGAPWYLLSLIFWHIFIYLTKHMKPEYVMAAAIILAAVLDYQEEIGKFLSLSRTLNFLPFFLFGYYISKEQFANIVNHKKFKVILPSIFFISMIFIFAFGKTVNKCFGVLIYAVSPYSKLPKPAYGFGPLLCLLWILAASILMFAVFIMCPRKKTVLSTIGRNTISIYVLHRLFKDLLFYAGFYSALSTNPYIAVLQIVCLSVLMVLLFGNAFSARIITNLSTIRGTWFYIDGSSNSVEE